MNKKNIAIILIFLLAVLGLVIGAYYTESADSNANDSTGGEIDYEDSNGVISITLEPEEKKESLIDRITNLTN